MEEKKGHYEKVGDIEEWRWDEPKAEPKAEKEAEPKTEKGKK